MRAWVEVDMEINPPDETNLSGLRKSIAHKVRAMDVTFGAMYVRVGAMDVSRNSESAASVTIETEH
jgi:hypothetical protein